MKTQMRLTNQTKVSFVCHVLNAMWTTSLTCAEVAGFVRTLPAGVHSARRLGVRSIGKSGFGFSKSGFRISNRTRNPKTDFNAEISVFGFSFLPFDWESEKGFEKLLLRTAVLHAHA